MEFAVMFIVGVIFGGILVYTLTHKKPVGNLRIDSSDPDGPYMFLELTTNMDYVRSERYITLNVVNKDYARK